LSECRIFARSCLSLPITGGTVSGVAVRGLPACLQAGLTNWSEKMSHRRSFTTWSWQMALSSADQNIRHDIGRLASRAIPATDKFALVVVVGWT